MATGKYRSDGVNYPETLTAESPMQRIAASNANGLAGSASAVLA
jgi:hypothetical protein